jgi:acetolactate synthase-1/2/3 large subunit
VGYAQAFGATGMRIDRADAIAATLRTAFDTAGPVVIAVPIDYSDNAKLFEMVKGEEIG